MKKDPRTDEQLYDVVRAFTRLRKERERERERDGDALRPEDEPHKRERDGDVLRPEDEPHKRASQEAGAQLYSRYFTRLRGFFINKVADGSRCDDLTHQTFKKILYELDNMTGPSFSGFLFGVAYNELRSDYRKAARQRTMEDIDEHPVASIGTGVSTLFARRSEEQRLVAALRQIPIKYQLVFEMYYWQDMTAEQIAALRGIPLGTVRGQIRLAKQALAAKLELVRDSFGACKEAFRSLAQWARELRSQLDPARDPPRGTH